MNDDFDDESESSFQKRQKELRAIRSDFKRAISEMKTISEVTNTEIFDENAAEEQNEEFFTPDKSEQIIESCQLRSIIRELNSMKQQVQDLQTMVLRARTDQRQIQSKLLSKIKSVINVLSQHIIRANNLLDDD